MNKIILTKDEVLRAQKHTLSNMAASRYLGISYNVYKRYALVFVDKETGKTLFDKHLNRQGKGIRKHLGGYGKSKKFHSHPLKDVLEGRVDVSHYTVDILKTRLIQEGFLIEQCNCCSFEERRVVDYKVPLVLNFKDKNKRNWKQDNLEFLCYNCYFLNVGNIWSDNQLKQMEDYEINDNTNNKDDKPTWDLDNAHIEHLKDLGLWEDEGEEFIDRI